MDNASNNRVCIEKLGRLLIEREFEIAFEPDQRRVMCHPHLVNLCTKHACEGFTAVDISEIEHSITTDTVKQCTSTEKPAPLDEHVSKQDYLEAIRSNPLEKARSLVRAIRASGLQRDAFKERIKVGNEQGWYKYPSGTNVPLVELLREVLMCWDMLLFMLNRLRILQPVRFSYLIPRIV